MRSRLTIISCLICAMFPTHAWSTDQPVAIAHVETGKAMLTQTGSVTKLTLKPRSGSMQAVVLAHPGDYPRGTNPPYEAGLIGEMPGHFLIFTDRFASNPGNVQGQCGASDSGERFLHVLSLVPPLRETLAIQIESCLLDIVPDREPVFDKDKQTLTLYLDRDDKYPEISIYNIAPDGSVLK